ncbi:MAG TPA: hypothetical protein VF552_13290 [Allosphingosinicella sp.]|jgi:hypothetical protein
MKDNLKVVGREWLRSVLVEPPSQSERVLSWVQYAMLGGLIILAIFAAAAPAGTSGVRIFTVGILAALASGAVGAALGLLFGLPISSRVTVVNQQAGRPQTQAAPDRQDWFSDNTSMEQIADWLTKIIVGLTLVNWGGLQLQFNRAGAAVTAAMLAPGDAASTRALMRGDAAMVPGSVVLGAYAVLGFLLAYLWSRRYLSAELAAGRGALIDIQKRAETAFVEQAAGAGAVQRPREDVSGFVTAALTRAASEQNQPIEVRREPFESRIAPGEAPDDPWKGQFGGHATDGSVEVTAAVEPLQTQDGFYAVELIVRGMNTIERVKLRSRKARIYLHPTFQDPVRENKFGASGRIRIPLVCYEGFTVGVHLEDGRLFELDLSELPNVPEEFRG